MAPMNERVARCMLVAKVLVADGIMTESEKTFLRQAMDRMGLSEEEREQVFALEGWDEAEPIVRGLSEDDKRALVDELTEAALTDGKLGPQETDAVRRITEALGL